MIDAIARKNSELGFDIRADFPQLFWVLRDFTLDLETNTPQDYLDQCLLELQSTAPEAKQKNKMRRVIKQYFARRTCLAFGRPAADEKVLRAIESNRQISADFNKEVDNLLQLLTLYIAPKTANKSMLTGKLFFAFLQTVIDAINLGEVPLIEGAVDRLLANEAKEKTRRVVNIACSRIERIKDLLPLEEKDLLKRYNDIVFEEFEALRDNLHHVSTKDMYKPSFNAFLEAVAASFSAVAQQNDNARQDSTNKLLNTLSATFLNLQDSSLVSEHLLPLLQSGLFDYGRLLAGILANIDVWLQRSKALRDTKSREKEEEWEKDKQEFREREQRFKGRLADKEEECKELQRSLEQSRTRIEEERILRERELEAKKAEIGMLKERLEREKEKTERERENLAAYKAVATHDQKINQLEGKLIDTSDQINEKDDQLNSLISKINESEKKLTDFSGKLKKDGFDLNDKNSSIIFDLIKQLSQNVETLNIEIRAKNQVRINLLTKRVDSLDPVVRPREGDLRAARAPSDFLQSDPRRLQQEAPGVHQHEQEGHGSHAEVPRLPGRPDATVPGRAAGEEAAGPRDQAPQARAAGSPVSAEGPGLDRGARREEQESAGRVAREHDQDARDHEAGARERSQRADRLCEPCGAARQRQAGDARAAVAHQGRQPPAAQAVPRSL